MINNPKKVKKRDGSIQKFDKSKILSAIQKAAYSVNDNKKEAEEISQQITPIVLNKIEKEKTPSVETIQDIIEKILMQEGYHHIAKAYILYREKRAEIRNIKYALDLKDDLKLPINSIEVLKDRYLRKDDRRNIIETPGELLRRVAKNIAKAEDIFKSDITREQAEEKFFHMMRNLEFLPNSPTLMNAGTSLGQLSACFVLPVEDSIDSIFESVKNMAKIHQTGGGTGFNFSRLRPKGDLVSTTKGESSGPVSFMKVFNQATQVIVQGGRRRGANMGILRCDHPDIVDFINLKTKQEEMLNFNLSVGVTDEFMDAVKKNDYYYLKNPRTGKKVKKVKAKTIFDLITYSAWTTGDPGLIFLDEINRKNPTPGAGKIEATNPCGELPLLPYESCNLASINLSRMISNDSIDWDKLSDKVHWGIRFLDDVIEVNKFPLKQIEEITFANRKVGLGVMGFADMLVRLGVPYTSKKACETAVKLMKFIHTQSIKASKKLARERSVFPNYDKSVYKKKNIKTRNAAVNTIAPTGTISIIAGCSSGIEPLFGISFVRNVLSGRQLFEANEEFEKIAKQRGFYNRKILAQVAKQGTLKNIKEIPDDVKKVFTTAFDVAPQQHLNIQAAFQRYTDNSVSKTINLPSETSVDEVKKIYLKAHELKCKGITIYRYGSKENQVLSFDSKRDEQKKDFIIADSEYSGGCAKRTCPF
ncbi:MAG: adenosylcobalamin-dependent ribonucleoside-diphosphate reductase [Elusimicrobiota bacterium]